MGLQGTKPLSGQSIGVNVIVTDHPFYAETLPDAYAIVHPWASSADYPFKYLAGCEWLSSNTRLLEEEVQVELRFGRYRYHYEYGELDQMKIVSLVQYGLKCWDILSHQSPEMLDMAGIAANEVTGRAVGFQIAPRLCSRALDDNQLLICWLVGDEAHEIALMIHQKNEERKEIVKSNLCRS